MMRNSLIVLASLLLFNGPHRHGGGGGEGQRLSLLVVRAHETDDETHTHEDHDDSVEDEEAVPSSSSPVRNIPDGTVSSSKLQIHVSKKIVPFKSVIFTSPNPNIIDLTIIDLCYTLFNTNIYSVGSKDINKTRWL